MGGILASLAGSLLSAGIGSALGGGSGKKERLQQIAAATQRAAEQETSVIQQERNTSEQQAAADIATARSFKFNRGAGRLLQFADTGEGGVPAKNTLG